MKPFFVERLLKIISENDSHDDLWWRDDQEDPDELAFYITCNDFFWWACADAERVTPENVEELARAYRDAPDDGGLLFCARERRMRPQGAFYPHLEESSWPLFDACGPVRETGMGNPHAHPKDEPHEP